MTAKSILSTGLTLASLIVLAIPAFADDIDEKQHQLQANINTAASNKTISAKDASALRNQMSTFQNKKRDLKAAKHDVLLADDTHELDKLLNAISQDFEARKNVKGSDTAKEETVRTETKEKSEKVEKKDNVEKKVKTETKTVKEPKKKKETKVTKTETTTEEKKDPKEDSKKDSKDESKKDSKDESKKDSK